MDAIIHFFQSVLEFITSIFTSLVWLVTNLPAFMSQISAAYVYLPDFILPFVVVSVALMVLFAIFRLL